MGWTDNPQSQATTRLNCLIMKVADALAPSRELFVEAWIATTGKPHPNITVGDPCRFQAAVARKIRMRSSTAAGAAGLFSRALSNVRRFIYRRPKSKYSVGNYIFWAKTTTIEVESNEEILIELFSG